MPAFSTPAGQDSLPHDIRFDSSALSQRFLESGDRADSESVSQTLPRYELKITLQGSKPAIWRRVQVPGSFSLNRLHDVIQVAMGWTDSHLHQFVDVQLFTLCLHAMISQVQSCVTNGVFAWLRSRDTKKRP